MARKIFTFYRDYFNCPDIDTHINNREYKYSANRLREEELEVSSLYSPGCIREL